MAWLRTCQECDETRTYRDPKTYSSDVWRDTPCRACKSMALDYGRHSERADDWLDALNNK